MQHPERKKARSYDLPGRCRRFTGLVYNGRSNDHDVLKREIFGIERDFYPLPPAYNLYFGDLHGHSQLSDGFPEVTPERYFHNLREKAKLDFAALSDHDHGGIGNDPLFVPEKWEHMRKAVKSAYEPGVFTTLLAYERDSYPWYNNLVVYYRDHEGMPLKGEYSGEITEAELRNALRRKDLILVPHDTGMLNFGCDFRRIPPDLMPPLLQIISRGGNAQEYFNHPLLRADACRGGFWQDALRGGGKVGVIACSDDHKGKGGMPDEDLLPDEKLSSPDSLPCLTGVWAKENTVSGIFDALQARRCYGFVGGRMQLDFRINGHYMGEEIALPANADREIYWKFEADSPLRELTIVKNCQDDLILRRGEGLIFDYTPEQATDCYYIRAITKDNRWCWSSPIWVTAIPGRE